MIIMRPTIGFSMSMKFTYQTQTKQYNGHLHLVCVEHGFVVNKTFTSIQQTVHKKVDLNVSIIQIEKHINVYYCSSYRRYITVHMFGKSSRNTHQTHTERDWSVIVCPLFDMQISLILKIQSISDLKSSCEICSLFAEANCLENNSK